jgi:Phosphotransferase enzyme family
VLEKVGSEKSVDFSNDKLCLCYADIAPHNFLITDANQLYVIDFEHAAFLPASFMSYIFHVPRSSFVSKVSSMVPFSKSGNLEALGLVSYHFHIRDSSSYG